VFSSGNRGIKHVQNDLFGRGLYAAQTVGPGVSEGASRTFPVIRTLRAAQGAVVELIERWAPGGRTGCGGRGAGRGPLPGEGVGQARWR